MHLPRPIAAIPEDHHRRFAAQIWRWLVRVNCGEVARRHLHLAANFAHVSAFGPFGGGTHKRLSNLNAWFGWAAHLSDLIWERFSVARRIMNPLRSATSTAVNTIIGVGYILRHGFRHVIHSVFSDHRAAPLAVDRPTLSPRRSGPRNKEWHQNTIQMALEPTDEVAHKPAFHVEPSRSHNNITTMPCPVNGGF